MAQLESLIRRTRSSLGALSSEAKVDTALG